MEKKCTKCGIVKDVEAFAIRSDTASGRKSHCKECHAVRFQKIKNTVIKAYKEKNKDREKAYRKERYQQNQETFREYTHNHYLEIKDTEDFKARRSASSKKYYAKNPERRMKVLVRSKAHTVALTGVCQHCGSDKKVERHHFDYTKPLEVIELCHRCHKLEHKLEKKFHVMESLKKAA
jgi:hypothetical protein